MSTSSARQTRQQSIDPHAIERAEIEEQLKQAEGAERKRLQEALVRVKRAQVQHAGAQLWRKDISADVRAFWTGVHRGATVGPDWTDNDARKFIAEHGTLSLSERQPQQQDEPSAEDRILADIAGKPLPDDRVPAVDPERVRRLHEAQALAERHNELTKLAEGVTPTQAWHALEYLEKEEAEGDCGFGLTEAERAAAILLRESHEERQKLHRLTREVEENRAAFDEIGRSGGTVQLSESSVYAATDADGVRLLCIDDSIFTTDPGF